MGDGFLFKVMLYPCYFSLHVVLQILYSPPNSLKTCLLLWKHPDTESKLIRLVRHQYPNRLRAYVNFLPS